MTTKSGFPSRFYPNLPDFFGFFESVLPELTRFFRVFRLGLTRFTRFFQFFSGKIYPKNPKKSGKFGKNRRWFRVEVSGFNAITFILNFILFI